MARFGRQAPCPLFIGIEVVSFGLPTSAFLLLPDHPILPKDGHGCALRIVQLEFEGPNVVGHVSRLRDFYLRGSKAQGEAWLGHDGVPRQRFVGEEVSAHWDFARSSRIRDASDAVGLRLTCG
jgi:hypothetical protein